MNTNKAPDTIYIPLYPNYNLDGVHLGDDWMYEPQKGCDNVTYICKDALLEWAKGFTDTKIFVSTLIEKLNSL